MHLITVVFLAKPAKFLRPLQRLWVIHGFNSRDSYTFPSSIVHRFQSVLDVGAADADAARAEGERARKGHGNRRQSECEELGVGLLANHTLHEPVFNDI